MSVRDPNTRLQLEFKKKKKNYGTISSTVEGFVASTGQKKKKKQTDKSQSKSLLCQKITDQTEIEILA